MPRRTKSHTPEYAGFFWSYQEYMDVVPENPELLTTYARDSDGVWYANGKHLFHDEVPSDLERVRFIQRG